MEQKDGGPAFSRAGNEWSEMTWVPTVAQQGMTLMDYFAAKAMQGILANEKDIDKQSLQDIADMAYIAASAMLIARSDK